MGDWTRSSVVSPIGATIHVSHPNVATCQQGVSQALTFGLGAGGTANRAVYIPFVVPEAVTARQMFWENGAVAGTTDVGIYDIGARRLVSTGPTTNAGTIQVVPITATLLAPGAYYMAFLPSTITTQTYYRLAVTASAGRACGAQQQDVGSATLPATATFAAGSGVLPFIGINFRATM